MKKRGFTLVELLAVIAILAILVIVAMPNVIDMFNSAKADTFVTEVQKYIDTAKTAFVSDAFSNPSETIYYSSVDNPTLGTSKLDMDGNKDYFIEMDRHGDFKRIIIKDDNFCYDVYTVGTNSMLFETKSKKFNDTINKTSVLSEDVWNSGNDSMVLTVSGSKYSISGCEGVTTVRGELSNSNIKHFRVQNIDYEFEEGMTWGEWLVSSYNINGFKLSSRPSYSRDDMLLGDDGCYIYFNESDYSIIYSNDLIVENKYYWSDED